MSIQRLYEKQEVLAVLERDRAAQFMSIGDLDDLFWPHTTWYGWMENGAVTAIALLYTGMELPTLLLFRGAEPEAADRLLGALKPSLPPVLNVHASPGLMEHFTAEEVQELYGRSYKMVLEGPTPAPHDPRTRRLAAEDRPALEALFAVAYPHNWFDPRLLAAGRYFGLFEGGELLGAAGVHVYSPTYRLAALGNITTHPGHRRRGIARVLTQLICHDLQRTVDLIGLNVRAGNAAALACYTGLGFRVVAPYDEFRVATV